MHDLRRFSVAAVVLLATLAGCQPRAALDVDAGAIFAQRCASCHGSQRYGGYAPPLIPASLRRKADETLIETILEGASNTQMEAFHRDVTREQAAALVAWMRTPFAEVRWDRADIAASRVAFEAGLRTIPATVERGNLILVVERGTGSVSVLDGDSMRELDRFPVGAIHGGLKFDLAFAHVFAATRDGTVVGYDLERGGLRAKVKAGVNTRNIAISPTARFVAVANQLPAGVVVLDGDLRPLRVFDLPGQPGAVYQLPGRPAFLLTLRDAPLLYTVEYPELRLNEVALPEIFEDFVFVPGRRQLLASSRGGERISLYDLDRGEILDSVETRGLPHLFSACFFERDGSLYAALNHIGVPWLSILDMATFEIEARFVLRGSGFFVRTHPGTPYLWADTNTDSIQLIDKQTLSLLDRTLTPEAGKQAMHVEFTASGERALVSIRDPEGAVVVYDSNTLEEIDRMPYSMPIGKYNAFNKTRLLY